MRSHESDIPPGQIIPDMDHQPVPVPLDVEHHANLAQETGGRMHPTNVGRTLPESGTGLRQPLTEKPFHIRVALPKSFQWLPGDDPHSSMLTSPAPTAKPSFRGEVHFLERQDKEPHELASLKGVSRFAAGGLCARLTVVGPAKTGRFVLESPGAEVPQPGGFPEGEPAVRLIEQEPQNHLPGLAEQHIGGIPRR